MEIAEVECKTCNCRFFVEMRPSIIKCPKCGVTDEIIEV